MPEKIRSYTGNSRGSRGIVVTDLDGTLLQTQRKVSTADLNTLELLKTRKIKRVIATGRSLFSARKVLHVGFPIDYLVFSSGAGVIEWPTKRLLNKHALGRKEVKTTVDALMDLCMDFMIHRPIPLNHHFVYYSTGRQNPDFFKRCEIYSNFAVREDFSAYRFSEACQVLAVAPFEKGRRAFSHLTNILHNLKVIRTTSPIDGRSIWIEVFPKEVSKASAVEWIGMREGISPEQVLAVGNDYNDLDLLNWAHSGFLVENAPEELKKQFETVSSNNDSGFTEAVEKWMGGIVN
ncbi:MAG TPA: HAD family phosphatase [Spirochaetes bacterium]|nr:HAD family phosphatase [Spirochaetota bacterium]